MKFHMASELAKLASLPDPPPDSGEPPAPETQGISTPERPWRTAAKAVGAGALGFGVGTAAGYGLQMGVEKVLGNHVTVPRVLRAAPILGGAMGLAYNQYKAREAEKVRDAIQSHQEQRTRGTPAR